MEATSPNRAVPPVRSGEAVTISATTYVSWQRCRAQALARLRGVYPRDSRASFRGLLAHRVFARHLVQGPIDASAFVLACREEIGVAMNPKVVSLGLRPSQIQGLISEVGELYDRFKAMPATGFRRAEVQIDVEPWPGVALKGIIDAVFDGEGAVRLVDWKTGSIGMAEHQMRFYAALWWLDCGELPARLEATSVLTGEQMARVPTQPEVDATLAEIAAIVSAVREALDIGGTLPTEPGPWCVYCPALPDCPDGATAAAVATA